MCRSMRIVYIFGDFLFLSRGTVCNPKNPIVYGASIIFDKKCWNEKAEKKHVLDQFYCL